MGGEGSGKPGHSTVGALPVFGPLPTGARREAELARRKLVLAEARRGCNWYGQGQDARPARRLVYKVDVAEPEE